MTEEYVQDGRAYKYNTERFRGGERSDIESHATEVGATFAGSPLGDMHLSGRGSSQIRQSALQNIQRTHGNRAVQRRMAPNNQRASDILAPQTARPATPRVTVQRFEITDFLNPVHEWITSAGLQAAGRISPDSTYDSPEAQEYSRGVRWNDDPHSMMTDKDEFGTDYAGGAAFLHNMDNFEHEAVRRSEAGEAGFGPGEDMQARTHFGDLQFLHGMAAKEGEEPEETCRKMMMWAEFTSKIAQGEIGGDVMLGDLGVGADLKSDEDDDKELRELSGMFPTMQSRSVNQLFGIEGRRETQYNMATEGKGDVQQRAAGSLMHMIQDSHAGGHSERDQDGNIVSFHSYTNQDHNKHGASDAPGEGGSVTEKLHNTEGGPEAIEHSAQVLRMLNNQDPYSIQSKATDWEDIQAHLETEVFPLAEGAESSSAGDDYEKDGGWAGWLLNSLPSKKGVVTDISHDIAGPTEALQHYTTDQWNSGIQTGQNEAWSRWESAEDNAKEALQYSPYAAPFRTIPNWQGGAFPRMTSNLPEKDPFAEDAGYYDMGPYEEGGSKVPGWEW